VNRSNDRRIGLLVNAGKAAVLMWLLLASFGSAAAERGAVTVIAAANAQSSVFVGFANGAVLFCSRLSGCTELEGTPVSRVTSLDTQGDGSNTKAWVGYENGSLYFCTLTGGCIPQELVPNPGKMKPSM
jgi:hypothetical protein